MKWFYITYCVLRLYNSSKMFFYKFQESRNWSTNLTENYKFHGIKLKKKSDVLHK